MQASRRGHFDEVWRAKIAAGDASAGIKDNRRGLKALSLLLQGERLLDVGCGTGTFAQAAAPRFREVHGIDVVDAPLRIARDRGLKTELVDAGTEPLPYPNGAFDTVVALSALQLVVDVDNVLRECKRVLRPGGQLIVCVPNMRAIWRLWKLAVKGTFPRTSLDSVGVDGGTVHYFTVRTIRALLEGVGLDIVNVVGVLCIPAWLDRVRDTGSLGRMKREFLSAEVLVDARTREL